MKKKYIRPESQLFLINLAENIAASGGSGTEGGGSDLIQNGIVLHFTQYVDGCRGVYTNDATAPVRVPSGGRFFDYLDDYYAYLYCPDHRHTLNENGCRGYA